MQHLKGEEGCCRLQESVAGPGLGWSLASQSDLHPEIAWLEMAGRLFAVAPHCHMPLNLKSMQDRALGFILFSYWYSSVGNGIHSIAIHAAVA